MADADAYERAGYSVTWRDQLARFIANLAFRFIATPKYRAFVTVTVTVGLDHLEEALISGEAES